MQVTGSLLGQLIEKPLVIDIFDDDALSADDLLGAPHQLTIQYLLYYSLLTTYYLLLTTYYSLLAIHYLLYYSLLTIHYLLFTTYSTIHYLLFITYSTIHYLLFIH